MFSPAKVRHPSVSSLLSSRLLYVQNIYVLVADIHVFRSDPFASLDDVRAIDLEDPRHYYNLNYNRIPEKPQREERLNSFLRQSVSGKAKNMQNCSKENENCIIRI